MKLLIDSADYRAIARLAEDFGTIIDGVTINPTLLKAQQEPALTIVHEILKTLPYAEVHLQVTEQEPEKIYRQAHDIAALAENMLVKIPCHTPYLPVISRLIDDNIPVNATLVFNVPQAAALAKLGAHYISLFVVLDDAGRKGISVAAQVQEMLDLYGFESELLVASVRSQEHIAGGCGGRRRNHYCSADL